MSLPRRYIIWVAVNIRNTASGRYSRLGYHRSRRVAAETGVSNVTRVQRRQYAQPQRFTTHSLEVRQFEKLIKWEVASSTARFDYLFAKFLLHIGIFRKLVQSTSDRGRCSVGSGDNEGTETLRSAMRSCQGRANRLTRLALPSPFPTSCHPRQPPY